jgi:hypothetical protein
VSKKKIPKFDCATKIKTVKRMLISALTRELKTARSVPCRWKDAYREDAEQAFRRKARRPPKSPPRAERVRAETAGELAAGLSRFLLPHRAL